MPSAIRVIACAVPLTVLLAGCADAATSGSSAPSFQHGAAQQQALSGAGSGTNAVPPAAQAAPPLYRSSTAGASSSADLGAAAGGNAKSADTSLSLGTPQGRVERSVNVAFVVPHDGFLNAFDALMQRAANLGGYVLSSTTGPGDRGRIDRGSLVVRVPAAKLNDMVTGTPTSWQVSSIDYGSIDHTAETVDLTARVHAVSAHRDALQKLLDHTTSLTDITTLETQLADVQQQLDQVQGQLNSVNDHVDMATATIALTEKGAVARPAPSPTPRLMQALADGWGNALAVAGAVILGLFSALPLLLLAVLALLVWRRLRRPARA